ncbi:GIY-YIG nuclease family protein [Bradyrhizobium sp. DASA03120]|uniref:GIY-YIG nuclease family protein n=1 Tax=Bradyrhizobium sp. SMVTL-02 TaxID=3395917 RepID=UPI003F709746
MISDDALRRRARFADFARMADFGPEHPDYTKLSEALKSGEDPDFERLLKAQTQRAGDLNYAYHLNGPGLYIDTYLRNFLLEYNGRIFKGKGNEQPTSFNILRSFVTPDDRAYVLKLLEEKFFQLNLLDYIDFVTGPSCKSSVELDSFEELAIYELNSAGSFAQVVLPGFDNLVFCGAAIVREDSEIAIVGVFGNSRSLFVQGDPLTADMIRPAKRQFVGDGPWDLGAEKLFDSEAYYPLIAMTRIDARKRRIEARYIMHETKDTFRVTTDDPAVMLDAAFFARGVDLKAAFQTAISELSQYRHVFDLLHNLLHFPEFVQHREDEFYIERHPTQLRLKPPTTRIRKLRSSLESKYVSNYREVLTLGQSSEIKAATLANLDLKFETSGYWRTLPMDKLGADKQGNTIHGKTWVEQQLSWRETGYNDADKQPTSVVPVSRDEDVGYVYVMRSPAHQRNIYKVGFTSRDPEDRANDLSATSGQPDALVVMQSWKVYEPRRVEQAIHRELEQLRINSRREFFKANFEKLRETIENVILGLNARVT